jgi:hypothetical protein
MKYVKVPENCIMSNYFGKKYVPESIYNRVKHTADCGTPEVVDEEEVAIAYLEGNTVYSDGHIAGMIFEKTGFNEVIQGYLDKQEKQEKDGK